MNSASRWSPVQMWGEAIVFSKLIRFSQTVNMVTEGSESTKEARVESDCNLGIEDNLENS